MHWFKIVLVCLLSVGILRGLVLTCVSETDAGVNALNAIVQLLVLLGTLIYL